jgi:hypothetical protein
MVIVAALLFVGPAAAQSFSIHNECKEDSCTITLNTAMELSWITFGSGVAVNTVTGEVRVPTGLPLDDAAKQFWNAVARVRGSALPFPGMPDHG